MQRALWVCMVVVSTSCELYATGEDPAQRGGISTSQPPSGNDADAGGGCGGEAAAGGFIAGPSDGPTNPENPYANAAAPGQNLPCSAFGFYEHQAFCKFFEACTLACTSDAACPKVAGAPVPQCRQAQTLQSCVLPCTSADECPSGMECVVHTPGLGQICMWPMTF